MSAKIEKTSTEKHEGDITCMAYADGYLYTGGADAKIKVWDKDLNLKNEISAHEAYIYAVAVNSKGKLYSGGCDGTIKAFPKPIESGEEIVLLKSNETIESIYIEKDVVYSGDDKGIVLMWVDDKLKSRVEIVEEVKGLLVELPFLYTVRDRDLSINVIFPNEAIAKYVQKGSIPGSAPIDLFGPEVKKKKAFLVLADKSLKGFLVVKNDPEEKWEKICEKDDAHEMIINALKAYDHSIFTGCYAGKVKQWILDPSSKKVTLKGEVETAPGNCINCFAPVDGNTVYCGSTDGLIRKITFS